MLVTVSFIAFTTGAWLFLRKAYSGKLSDAKYDVALLQKEYETVRARHETIVRENDALKRHLDEIIVLYEITKEIAKTMDEEKIFSSFRQRIDRYLRINDCRFQRGEIDLSLYRNHIVLALRLQRQTVGYLIADGVAEDDREKFLILAQQFLLSVKRAILYERLAELSITDTLTAVFTRRHYMERVQEEIEYSKKYKAPFAFLMLDIDHFKEYNDHYGHLVGDAILKEVSKVMKENLRQVDLIGRYGGEEFSIMLTQTNKEGARFAAERIRRSLEGRDIRVYDEHLRVTISIGIAIFPDDAPHLQVLLERADRALYRAKETGRNKVCIHGEP